MDKVTRQCPQTTRFLKKKESRNGIEPRSFRLPLGQTGSPLYGLYFFCPFKLPRPRFLTILLRIRMASDRNVIEAPVDRMYCIFHSAQLCVPKRPFRPDQIIHPRCIRGQETAAVDKLPQLIRVVLHVIGHFLQLQGQNG